MHESYRNIIIAIILLNDVTSFDGGDADVGDDDATTQSVNGICFHGSPDLLRSTFATDLHKSTTITTSRPGNGGDDDVCFQISSH